MVLEVTSKGLYCKAGDIHIDPSSKVKHAFITHAHADHARKGSEHYYCTPQLEPLLRHRIGKKGIIHAIPFRKKVKMNNAIISFHPAGHMLGSAQIRVEHNNQVWVVSGDYKRENDPSCEPFEVVKCNTFITEATFAHPSYTWRPSKEIVGEMVAWYKKNRKAETASVIVCYSLGKAQRILGELAPHIKEVIYLHPTMAPYTKYYEKAGYNLGRTKIISEKTDNKPLKKSLILIPPSVKDTFWLDHLGEYESAFVSGWAHNSSNTYGCDKGFCLSDHADWPALIRTIEETGATKVLVTHGNPRHLVSYLRQRGIEAEPLEKSVFSRGMKDKQLTLGNFFRAED